MAINCPQCGTLVDAVDVSPRHPFTTCDACGQSIAVVAAPTDGATIASPPTATQAAEDHPRPAGLSLEQTADGLRTSWRWWRKEYVVLLFFTIGWDAFLVFWYLGTSGGGWIQYVFPIGHVAVGVGLAYFLLCCFVNRTVVELTYHELRVWHGPMPLWRNRRIAAERILRLGVRETSRPASWADSESNIVHELYAVDVERTKHAMVALREEDEARYLKQEFERFLGIEKN